jgi:hypothetical protein
MVWRCLGYVRDEKTLVWSPATCFPKWAEKYPSPPDVIGVTRTYTKEVDGPVLKANQGLVRSIPDECKQNLKAVLKPYGFKVYYNECKVYSRYVQVISRYIQGIFKVYLRFIQGVFKVYSSDCTEFIAP